MATAEPTPPAIAPLAVDKATAAAMLSLSARTIDRLRESGRLRPVEVRAVQTRRGKRAGGAGKIIFAVAELQRFLASTGGGR